MKNKIRVYVETLFDGALKTEEVVELREEILQNVIDKYNDLVADGKSEDEAYKIAVSGIGDINELLRSMGNDTEDADDSYKNGMDAGAFCKEKSEAASDGDVNNGGKGKTAFLCTAVVLYILSLIPVIIADDVIGTDVAEEIGVCLMFVICAIATAFIIAYVASKPKKVEKAEDAKDEDENLNPVAKSINSAIWSVGVALYFILSFATGGWFITWLIFLITDAITEVVKAYFDMREQ